MDDELRRLLTELSAAIDRSQAGEEDRADLARLLAAVEGRLNEDARPEEHRSLVDTLKAAEGRFETDHPVLGSAIRQAIQALSAAGI